MLKQRVLTAVILVPLVLALILFAPLWLFDAVVGLALLVLAWEYTALCRFSVPLRTLFSLAMITLFALAATPSGYATVTGNALLGAAILLWLVAPAWLVMRHRLPDGVKFVAGLPWIAGAGIALHGLKVVNPDGRWVLAVFVIVWAADIGGYAVGRTLGRHKLAPAVSPGKTWEGFIGGVLLVLFAGFVAAYWLIDRQLWLAWAVLLSVAAVISVVGDLAESLLKRQAGVKDSSNLLPGHGGLLDRLDSLLAVAPVFLLAGFQIGIFSELSPLGS